MRRATLSLLVVLGFCSGLRGELPARPNVLWITSEDNAPHLGCYGDKFAVTPNLDRLAARGMVYETCWSNAPVCAPARTALITGVYPTSTGAEHMRSMVPMPVGLRMFPQLLREAGYYCVNNAKEDYNIEKPGQVWDQSSARAHWRNRAAGQPFFAVFNLNCTHESRIRKRPHEWKHDPGGVRVPAYHPDVPEVRQDWAQYYDQMTEMDGQVGELLADLDRAGLADDTIVFYFGDNGPGMPRCKRSACDSGLHVPLIVYVPPRWAGAASRGYAAESRNARLVSFVDFAPTMLSLVGIEPPAWMQGRAFLGGHASPDPPYIFGFRGRMDERYDMVRSVRDGRYVYVRNYMPHRPSGQHNAYMFETPSTQAWKRLYDEGKLPPTQAYFWQTRAPEELYDLKNDSDEVRNLVTSADHHQVLQRMRDALHEHLLAVRDVGFLPEGEIHNRAQGSTPHDMARDGQGYQLKSILAMADAASRLDPDALPQLKKALATDRDSAIRYWAAMGFLMRGREAIDTCGDLLRKALGDESPYVRIVAAEALGRFGGEADLSASLGVLVDLGDVSKHGPYAAMSALNALDAIGPIAAPASQAIAALPRSHRSVNNRIESAIPRLLDAILEKTK